MGNYYVNGDFIKEVRYIKKAIIKVKTKKSNKTMIKKAGVKPALKSHKETLFEETNQFLTNNIRHNF